MSQFNVTELDYDKIKENLINHFKKLDPEYSDYDFEGSGLNIMMDILAYNTHYNAIHAHTSINETFLDSAQLRHNVVSRAKLLGYTPSSIRAASCSFDLEIKGDATKEDPADDPDDTYILPAGQTIEVKVLDRTYTFRTLEDYQASYDEESDSYKFKSDEDPDKDNRVTFYEGVIKSQKFIVRDQSDKNQKYILKDTTADTSQLKVKVYDHAQSTSYSVYRRFASFNNIDADSRIYFISENYSSHHEVEFGNGVYGKRPTGQNIIEFEYLSTSGSEANGSKTVDLKTIKDLSDYTLLSRSAGGAEKEDIESIRFHAPLTYAAQDRAVTVNDYQGIISRDFPEAVTSSVWGGQHNDPPKYGTVFVCINPKPDEFGNKTLTPDQKNKLEDILSSKNVASTTVEVVDPDFTSLILEIIFKYDPSLTNETGSALETKIKELLVDYNNDILRDFNTVFRYSNFLNAIDNTDDSIINSTVRVSAYKEKLLFTSEAIPNVFNFGFEVYGDILEKDTFITSDQFKYKGHTLYLKDEPLSPTTRKVYAYRLDELDRPIKVIKHVGTLNPKEGVIHFDALPVDEEKTIKIYCSPASNDIAAKRNVLISIDESRSNIVADIDTIRVGGSAGAVSYKTHNRHG